MNTKVLLKGKGDDILLPITRGELVLDASGNEAFRSGQFLATKESNGLMSLDDKKKLVTYTLEGTSSIEGYAITLSNDGDIDETTSVVPIFAGATDRTSGKSGLVPESTTSDTEKYLRGDGKWETPTNTTYSVVSTSKDGLAPKIVAFNSVPINDSSELVLTATKSGSPAWKTLPANAFNNDNTTYELSGNISADTYVINLEGTNDTSSSATISSFTGAKEGQVGQSGLVPAPKAGYQNTFLKGDGSWGIPVDTWVANSANDDGYVTKGSGQYNKIWKTNEYGVPAWRDDLDFKVAQTNISLDDDYRVLLSQEDGDVTGITNKSSKLTFNPYTGILTSTRFEGNLDGVYVDKLTAYSKGSSSDAINTRDSLNTALGKLECKSNLGLEAYNWYKSVTEEDNDKYINKWYEIVDFLDSVKEDTDILDEFVTRKTEQTITGFKTFNPESKDALTLSRTNYSTVGINFKYNTTDLGWIGFAGQNNIVFKDTNNDQHNLLHSGNSSVSKSGETLTVKINGVTKSLTNSTYTELPNPYSISFKDTSNNTVTYDGSRALNLTAGINYASNSSNLNYHTNLYGDTAIDNFLNSGVLKVATFSQSSEIDVSDGILMSLPWSSYNGVQLAFDDSRDVKMFIRGKASTWGDWYTIMHSNNFSTWINETNFPGLNKVGTVTSVAVGTGLRLQDSKTSFGVSGTISCNLSSTTSLGTLGSTNGLCAVGIDSYGKLCVLAPTSPVSVMTGATTYSDGASGLVPKPTTSDVAKFLCGNGKWKEISADNTTYTFDEGENCFYVTPSDGIKQAINVTPKITNNITGSGTNGYIAKFSGKNTITNGPAFGSDTTKYLKNDGTWDTPPDTKNTAGASSNTGVKLYLIGATAPSSSIQTYTNPYLYITSNSTLKIKDTFECGGSVSSLSTYLTYAVAEKFYQQLATCTGNVTSMSGTIDSNGNAYLFGTTSNSSSSNIYRSLYINGSSTYQSYTVPAGKKLSVIVKLESDSYMKVGTSSNVYSCGMGNTGTTFKAVLSETNYSPIFLNSHFLTVPTYTTNGNNYTSNVTLTYTNPSTTTSKTIYVRVVALQTGIPIQNVKTSASGKTLKSGTLYMYPKASITSAQLITPEIPASQPSGDVALYGSDGYVLVNGNNVTYRKGNIFLVKNNNFIFKVEGSTVKCSSNGGKTWGNIP